MLILWKSVLPKLTFITPVVSGGREARMTTELSKICSLLSLPLNRSFLPGPRGTHAYGAHGQSDDLPSVCLFCSRHLISFGHILSQHVCTGHTKEPLGHLLAGISPVLAYIRVRISCAY